MCVAHWGILRDRLEGDVSTATRVVCLVDTAQRKNGLEMSEEQTELDQ